MLLSLTRASKQITGPSRRLSHSWINYLMQLQTMSEQKAELVARHYPSFAQLRAAFQSAPSASRERLLEGLCRNYAGARRLGPVLSKRVYAALFANEGEL